MYIHGAPRLSTLSNPQAPHQPSDWPSGTFDLQARVLPLQAPPELGGCCLCSAFIDFQPKSSLFPALYSLGTWQMLDIAFWALCEQTPPPSREHLHLELRFFHPPDFFCSCAFALPSPSSGAPSPLLCLVNPLTHLLIPAQRVPFPKAPFFSWWCLMTSLLFVSLFSFPHRQFLKSESIPCSCPGPST